MKAVLQRVKHASVTINNELYSKIDRGILVLYGVEKGDTPDKMEWMAKKIASLRIFEDINGKMNLSCADISGEILVVSQFTLAADCAKGTRPGFDKAEKPQQAEIMYENFIKEIQKNNLTVKSGKFGAMMDIVLLNDGPVTIILNKKKKKL